MSTKSRPPTPDTPQFRYLPKDQWPAPIVHFPNLGDFVVLTVDPVASVAHLDEAAKHAARALPRQRFVALVMEVYGLPLNTKPFTHCSFALVRQGLPTRHNPPWDSPEMCYPILPNARHPTRDETVQPIHPLPLDDCYIDMTSAFLDAIRCRVTTSPRDYTPVLRVTMSQLTRLEALFSDEVANLEDIEERLAMGDLDAIASVPLPTTPLSAFQIPLPPSPSLTPLEDKGPSEFGMKTDFHASRSEGSEYGAERTAADATDEVSMIGSDDSDSSVEGSEELGSEAADDQLFEMLRFENILNDVGDLRDPAVHVSYDLSEVGEVVDPISFIKIRDELRRIIDEAEIRLGIRVESAPSARSPPPKLSPVPSTKLDRSANAVQTTDTVRNESNERVPRMMLLRKALTSCRRASLSLWDHLRGLATFPCHSASATSDAM
ncbi:unnamed protein product [Peniophora sp. CBMAI 1063]|nr:unnamed protein product [Peniophora sp. CBMAI 1063]